MFLLPTVVYEVYRTGGVSTKLSSILLLIVYIAETFLIIANVNYDLAKFFGAERKIIAGYAVPLGDIKVVGPILMAILSIILFACTRGRYTKWLAIIIFITSFVIAYSIDPENFSKLLRFGIDTVFDQVRYLY